MGADYYTEDGMNFLLEADEIDDCLNWAHFF
jgi:hypothetical protein